MSFASIERKNLSREESERKQYGHKIDILFRIDDTEYFGSETYVDESTELETDFLQAKTFPRNERSAWSPLKEIKFYKRNS